MQIKVLFFGVLSEVAGTAFRTYNNIKSYDDLMLRIRDDVPEITGYNYMTAVNNEITSGEVILHNDDEVALMPPFAGG